MATAANVHISKSSAILDKLLYEDSRGIMAQFRRTYEGELFPGNTVNIRVPVKATVRTLTNINDDVTWEDGDLNKSTLTVDQYRYIAQRFYDIDQAFSNVDVSAAALVHFADDLLDNMLTNVLSLAQSSAGTALDSGNFNGTATNAITLTAHKALSTNDYVKGVAAAGVSTVFAGAVLARAGRLLKAQKCYSGAKFAIVHPTFSELLSQQENLTAANDQFRQDALARGAVKTYNEFMIFETNNVPTSGSNYYALFCHESAIDVAGGVRNLRVNDPLEAKFGSGYKIANIFGRAATNSARIISALHS